MRLAIDVMGGDQGPQAIIAGAAKAAVEHPTLELILFGPQIGRASCRERV